MKKYIICFLSLVLILTGIWGASYYYMYRLSLPQTAREEGSTSPGIVHEENAEVVADDVKIKPETQLIVQTYDLNAQTITEEALPMPAMYLGMTRQEILEALKSNLTQMDLTELQKGLISYDLISFSRDMVTLRKTYYVSEDYHKYYLALYKGSVTIYYSDQKTVYDYTDIQLSDLPLNIRSQILSGIKIKDDQALYNFLENYTS